MSWAFDPQNAAQIAGWAFWLGIAGLTVTILAFLITIWQVRRAGSLASAAQNEVKRIRQALVSFDTAREASRAEYAIAEAKVHLRNESWADVANSYEVYRRSMLTLKETMHDLPIDVQNKVDAASKYIIRLRERIERDRIEGKTTVPTPKTVTLMSNHDELVFIIRQLVQKGLV